MEVNASICLGYTENSGDGLIPADRQNIVATWGDRGQLIVHDQTAGASYRVTASSFGMLQCGIAGRGCLDYFHNTASPRRCPHVEAAAAFIESEFVAWGGYVGIAKRREGGRETLVEYAQRTIWNATMKDPRRVAIRRAPIEALAAQATASIARMCEEFRSTVRTMAPDIVALERADACDAPPTAPNSDLVAVDSPGADARPPSFRVVPATSSTEAPQLPARKQHRSAQKTYTPSLRGGSTHSTHRVGGVRGRNGINNLHKPRGARLLTGREAALLAQRVTSEAFGFDPQTISLGNDRYILLCFDHLSGITLPVVTASDWDVFQGWLEGTNLVYRTRAAGQVAAANGDVGEFLKLLPTYIPKAQAALV